MSKSRFEVPTCLTFTIVLICSWIHASVVTAQNGSEPITDSSVVFAEKDGFLAVEAEHFYKQTLTDKRAFYVTSTSSTPDVSPDKDPPHLEDASGGAYLEILPDTRVTHADKLTTGLNFSNEAGKMCIAHYKINVTTPGRYYVWVRAFSIGTEDNGLHVGIDGTWPESGQRLQWAKGKGTWRWDSMQRTEKVHTGVPHQIYLDIKEAGEHEIQFSMREDGFEFDRWLMTTDRDFKRPADAGPATLVHVGTMPNPFPAFSGNASAAAGKTKAAAAVTTSNSDQLVLDAAHFADGEAPGYYLDQGKWLAVNPDTHKSGSTKTTFPYPTGLYNVTLAAVGENDGSSTYQVTVAEDSIGEFTCPLSKEMFEEGPNYSKTWNSIQITDGSMVGVSSQLGTLDGEFSRARWSALKFEPADDATRAAVKPVIEKMATAATKAEADRKTSPTKNVSNEPQQQPRQAHGDGSVSVTGELMTWHKVSLTMNGPFAHEKDNAPNPFLDYRMTATFTHSDGTTYKVPGYFATDGNAKETSAESGTQWRVLFAPDRAGEWKYSVSFATGKHCAIDSTADAKPLAPFDAQNGSFEIAATNKTGRDLRAHGRLTVTGNKRYLQFAGTKKYFLKVGADAPETLFAFKDFDNTIAKKPNVPLKEFATHVADWNEGDPTWQGGKGKGLIGAINYLSSKGCNAFSFLTYNAGGDGDNVWPFIHRDDKLHYDTSKLDQWGTVMEHGTAKGMYLHFKLQETEIDDHQSNHEIKKNGYVPECFDGGYLGVQRKLYLREIIARFGHNLALNWNLGEENTQSTEQQNAMLDYIAELDPYQHNRVVHTYPQQQDKVYRALLGSKSKLTGASLQNNNINTTHVQTAKWIDAANASGKPWVVAFDESGSAAHAQVPDLGYMGFDGHDKTGKMAHTQHEVRKQTLWGHLMAGGAGCEYYFGYQNHQNDLICEDWRSRDASWDYCAIAINFFHDNEIPFWEMECHDQLIGNPKRDNSKYCFAKADEVYLVYLPNGGTSSLDMTGASGDFKVMWFNPRTGGDLQTGSVKSVAGGATVELGTPPSDEGEDWLVLARK